MVGPRKPTAAEAVPVQAPCSDAKQCLNFRERVESPQLFTQPPPLTHCQIIMHLWSSNVYTIYVRLTSQFWSGSDRRTVHPPSAKFSQFKHMQ